MSITPVRVFDVGAAVHTALQNARVPLKLRLGVPGDFTINKAIWNLATQYVMGIYATQNVTVEMVVQGNLVMLKYSCRMPVRSSTQISNGGDFLRAIVWKKPSVIETKG